MRGMNGLIGSVRRVLPRRGLEEFFDANPTAPIAGRKWQARDLRRKSNEDLHKLWYVLLKERNMLHTMKNEARRIRSLLPAADRMRKVKKGMGAIKQVISERDAAVYAYRKDINQQTPVRKWDLARQVIVLNIHCDVEEEEFVQLMEEHGIEPVRYELLIERHAKYGEAVIEMKEKGDGKLVKEKLHNLPFIDGRKLRVMVDPGVNKFGLLSKRVEPSEMIVRARILKYKQFPAEEDPLRPNSKYKRQTEIEAGFDRLRLREKAHEVPDEVEVEDDDGDDDVAGDELEEADKQSKE